MPNCHLPGRLTGSWSAEAVINTIGLYRRLLQCKRPNRTVHWDRDRPMYAQSLPLMLPLPYNIFLLNAGQTSYFEHFTFKCRIRESLKARRFNVMDVLKGSPRASVDGPFDVLYEVSDQIGSILNERFREDLELVAILVESVSMNTVMAQCHCVE